MSRSLLFVSCLALVAACSSNSNDDSKSARAESGGAAGEASADAWPGVPTTTNAPPLVDNAPTLSLSAKGIELAGKSVVEADMSGFADGLAAQEAIGEPVYAALADARRAAEGKPLVIAGAAELPFASVGALTLIAGRAGFESLAFIVQTKPGEHGMLSVKPPDDAPAKPGPALHVVMDSTGYHLLIAPATAPAPGAPPRRPAIAVTAAKTYDGAALEAKVAEFTKRLPSERATLMVEAGVDLGSVVLTIAAMRGSKCVLDADPDCQIREVVLSPIRYGESPPPPAGLVGAGRENGPDLGDSGLIGKGGFGKK